MDKQVYDKRSWRNLPRDRCEVAYLFGDVIGPCKGMIHLHHTDPADPDSCTIQICAGHHSRLHAALRQLERKPEWKRCSHRHPYPGTREACERRLNGIDLDGVEYTAA